MVTAITTGMFISPTAARITRQATGLRLDLRTGLKCTARLCTAHQFIARTMARTAGLIVPTMAAKGLTAGIVRVVTDRAGVKLLLRQKFEDKVLEQKAHSERRN